MEMIKFMLIPLTFVYAIIVNIKWRLYKAGVLKKKSVQSPVISIGNIALGGTGKTPCTIWLSRKLSEMGKSPIILTRGYSRTSKSRIILDGESIGTARLFGDEPLMFISKNPNIPVVIHKNRFKSIMQIGDNEGHIFILDDGLQYQKLSRTFDLVLLPAENPLSEKKFFPLGGLRDGLWRLAEADAILIIGEQTAKTDEVKKFLLPETPIFIGKKAISEIKTLDGKKLRANTLQGKCVVAFSGIGNPASFEETLSKTGAVLKSTVRFRDHHQYKIEDLKKVEAEAERVDAEMLVTTEKDAVRLSCLKSRLDIIVVCIKLEINNEEELLKTILNKITHN